MRNTLEEQAKKAVEYTGRTSLGMLTREDVALIVVPPHQDKEVLQAILDALKKKGISVDVAWEHDLIGVSYEELILHNAAEGWKELLYFQPSMAEFLTSRGIVYMPPGRTPRLEELGELLAEFIRKNPK